MCSQMPKKTKPVRSLVCSLLLWWQLLDCDHVTDTCEMLYGSQPQSGVAYVSMETQQVRCGQWRPNCCQTAQTTGHKVNIRVRINYSILSALSVKSVHDWLSKNMNLQRILHIPIPDENKCKGKRHSWYCGVEMLGPSLSIDNEYAFRTSNLRFRVMLCS